LSDNTITFCEEMKREMKKYIALMLVLVLCLQLVGCQSKEAAAADDLIEAIGTVTLESGAAIETAEAAYAALEAEDREQVEKLADLEQARAAYNALVDAAEAKAVETLIADLGEITPESETAIAAAQEAYDALGDSAKALVTNTDVLAQAANTLQRLVMKQQFLGIWYVDTVYYEVSQEGEVSYYNPYFENISLNVSGKEPTYTLPGDADAKERHISGEYFFLTESDFYCGKGESKSKRLGTWDLNEDMTAIVVDLEVEGLGEELVLKIFEEDGFKKIRNYISEEYFSFVHERDAVAAFDAKYVTMKQTTADTSDFFGDPVDLGYLYDENGNRINVLEAVDGRSKIANAWLIPSKAYEQGLVYIDGLQYSFNCTINGSKARGSARTPIMTTDVEFKNMELTGAYNATFVRADHVAKNYIDEDGYRTVELTDGTVFRCLTEDFFDEINQIWKYVQADYNDYIY